MAGEASIRMVNDWRATTRATMADALAVSRDVFRRTAPQACKHAIILMAQSAAKRTKIAPKTRPVLMDGNKPYVEIWSGGKMKPLYKWQAESRGWDWERAQRIGKRGLARRSWMWGLSSIKGDVAGYTGRGAYSESGTTSHPIAGASAAWAVKSGGETVGYVLENRLGYINAAFTGSVAELEQLAINKIMGFAEKRMVGEFARDMNRAAFKTGGQWALRVRAA